MKVLVTGGAGYIGSHFVRYLISNGHEVIIFDNLSRGNKASVPVQVPTEVVDIQNRKEISEALLKHPNIDAVVHFAAFAYVGESVEHPEMYYKNNVIGSLNLISAVNEAGIKKFVFSSTCSLYGNPLKVPISESESVKPINPYAQTKRMIENILADFDNAYNLKYVALRYFNAAGADDMGNIGESHDPEPHLIPLVLKTALGKRDMIYIFGNDYDTPDGTCVRDYIHVNDLADAHLKAIDYLNRESTSNIFNLGTGSGYSVKQIIDEAVNVTGKQIETKIVNRRAGDPAVLVADNKKAKEILGWVPKYDLRKVIETAWNWHSNQKF